MESVSDTAQKLKAALKLLGPSGRKWMQDGLYWNRGKCCAAGACYTANTDPKYLIPFVPGGNVEAWNDAPERTFADVKAVFEKAIEANL